MFDFHTHTDCSHDCKRSIDKLCEIAIQNKIEGFAVTDHAETWYYVEHYPVTMITRSIEAVKRAREKYNIKIFQGIELGSPYYKPDISKELMELCDYDVVLNSVHCAAYGGIAESFAAIDFSNLSLDIIHGLLNEYFTELEYTAQNGDFDVLCHITYPFRYINGRYSRNIDVALYENRILNILQILIKRGKSLEINTASMGGKHSAAFDCPCPDEYYIKKYYDMGGRIVTLGSDTHTDTIANGFDTVIKLLKSIGFDKITYFEKRKMFFEQI